MSVHDPTRERRRSGATLRRASGPLHFRFSDPCSAAPQSMLAKEIKTGAVVSYNDAPCIIETITVQSPSARGAATFYKYRARNLITKQKVDITLRGGDSLPEANFERRAIKLMYVDATHAHWRIDRCWVGPDVGSDHRPVLADLTLTAGEP